jgi:hypothetical protein
MSSYTDPIAIVLKFRRGLNAMMQDNIAESGTDRPQDTKLCRTNLLLMRPD